MLASMSLFFFVGLLLREKNDIEIWMLRHYKLVLPVFLSCFAIMMFFWQTQLYRPWEYGMAGAFEAGNLGYYLVVERLYKVIMRFLACVFVWVLFRKCFGNITNKAVSFFCEIGKYTLGIYLLQHIIIELFLGTLVDFTTGNYVLDNLVIAPIVAFAVMLLCFGINKVMEKNRYVGLLFFGKQLEARAIKTSL